MTKRFTDTFSTPRVLLNVSTGIFATADSEVELPRLPNRRAGRAPASPSIRCPEECCRRDVVTRPLRGRKGIRKRARSIQSSWKQVLPREWRSWPDVRLHVDHDPASFHMRATRRSSSSMRSGSEPLCTRIPSMILRGTPRPVASM